MPSTLNRSFVVAFFIVLIAAILFWIAFLLPGQSQSLIWIFSLVFLFLGLIVIYEQQEPSPDED